MARKITIVMNTLSTQDEQSAGTMTVTSSGNSRPYPEFARCDSAVFLLDVTAASLGGTLDVKIQGWNEAAGKWHDIDELTFEQVSATGSQMIEAPILYFKRYRAVWTVGGDEPSFTFTLVAIASGL